MCLRNGLSIRSFFIKLACLNVLIIIIIIIIIDVGMLVANRWIEKVLDVKCMSEKLMVVSCHAGT